MAGNSINAALPQLILGAAAILMLVTGCGLIALMFYSRRKGYDEPARSNRMRRE
jgi:hypothetical protein